MAAIKRFVQRERIDLIQFQRVSVRTTGHRIICVFSNGLTADRIDALLRKWRAVAAPG